jgi:ribosomal RNA-processing protein 9
VADEYKGVDVEGFRFLRNGHKLAITCLVVSQNGKYIFSGSKDCSLVKWCLETGKKLKVIPGGRKGTEEQHVGHTSHIMALAMSTDSKFLVSGSDNNLIIAWNPENMELLHKFKGHRGAVSGLAFRKNSHTLFSCSHDRSVKVWDLDEMSYIETLFGHQEAITAIDSLTRERALTAGGRDSSVRIWKIVEESQLVFQGNGQSVDCVKFLDEHHFVSGSDDGSVSLWGLLKKKPLVTISNSHGVDGAESNWITSVATFINTDLFATGSKDGQIRLWKCSPDFKKIVPLFSIPVTGFINSLQFTPNGNSLVVGVGQEHRLGRWWRIKEAKNQILIIPLIRQDSGSASVKL